MKGVREFEHNLTDRLTDLRALMATIPGADNKAWMLEFYDETGQVTRRYDIRTGAALPVKKTERAN